MNNKCALNKLIGTVVFSVILAGCGSLIPDAGPSKSSIINQGTPTSTKDTTDYALLTLTPDKISQYTRPV